MTERKRAFRPRLASVKRPPPHKIIAGEKSVFLLPTEAGIFNALFRAKGEICRREQLLKITEFYAPHNAITSKVTDPDVIVKSLQGKLDKLNPEQYPLLGSVILRTEDGYKLEIPKELECYRSTYRDKDFGHLPLYRFAPKRTSSGPRHKGRKVPRNEP
jgi:hypothetical protein